MYIYHAFGKLGEDIATKYLLSKNYKMIERNFWCKQGEIDIIAKDKNEIVFIEVKTRSSTICGRPSEAVTETKQKHIKKAAKYYIYLNHIEDYYIRIDVIEVYLRNNKFYINHIKQII
jgi:putative endonuclease